jgi:thiol-disulfide isomerase/thioredoxin
MRKPNIKVPWLLTVLALTAVTMFLVGACGTRSTSTAEPAETVQVVLPRADGPMAPDLVGTQAWVNSEPLTLDELRGKVVLIDFWTYTCVNCIRTFPLLKIWHSKYTDDGLVIIGVHTPEFQFEHDLDNLKQAMDNHGIEWAVVQDNRYATWDAFNNRFWPAKYLIDKNGVVRYEHFGEGNYDETEFWIRGLLLEAGADLSDDEALDAQNSAFDFTFRNSIGADVTAELYGGYERGCGLASLYSNSSIDDSQYCKSKNKVASYTDSGEHKKHKLYLQGEWLAEKESVRHARDTGNLEDYMLLRFASKSVNVVIRPEQAQPFKVLVTLDGQFMNDQNKGEDVIIEEDGRSFLVVDQPRLYAVVEAPEYGDYELKLSSDSSDFAVSAFTFGIYADGI